MKLSSLIFISILPSLIYNKNWNSLFSFKYYCNTTVLWQNIFDQFLVAVSIIQVFTIINKFNVSNKNKSC